MFKSLIVSIIFLCASFQLFAQDSDIWLNPNKGQWDSRIHYKTPFSGGELLLENKGLTYLFNNAGHKHTSLGESVGEEVLFHAVKSDFINANEFAVREENSPSIHYINYYLGNDASKWQTKVFSYQEVKAKSFYPGIDFLVSTKNEQFEYQFFIQPGADINQIKRKFEGADKLQIDSQGNLIIKTSLGEVSESRPRAFELSGNDKKEIRCKYLLRNNILSFSFPDGYDNTKEIWIDPSLTFSTFTGSTADNWGMTAAPGPNGEAIGGGISFGAGYPTTTGAYGGYYNGGEQGSTNYGFDIGISKFSINGSQLLFSTYIGGSKNELPQSMVCTTNGDLYILGITSSPNFPTTVGAFDRTFAGGSTNSASGLDFSGTDIYVLKLSVDGTQLLASTLLGGASNDGFNIGRLQYNYGDGFRGDIIIDGLNNVYVATNSASTDFPKTLGDSYSGSQDAVVFKMNNDLTSLIWSRFIGGSGFDCANSLILSNSNRLYVAGGTTSTVISGFTNGSNGGEDGFLLELNPQNGTFVTGKFIGSTAYDQIYFVQTDLANDVYIFGQTEGPGIPVTPGRYNNPNSGQFLQKYSADLSQLLWSTRIGAGRGKPEISPTAFLVSDCDDILFSGWGGIVNSQYSLATYSSSNNFPITPDAFQGQTNGSNFYLGILNQNATSLIYGTYMGGVTSSSNHVDGGTSRFDKSGAVYHSVCAACQGNRNGFTTTPGAYTTQNPSANCNMAVFKFQLGLPYSLSENTRICEGESYQLNAVGATSYRWSPSTGLSNPLIANPVARPTQTTVYYVQMDFSSGCSVNDSIIVEVVNKPTVLLVDDMTICSGGSTTVSASGGSNYSWSPDLYINQTNGSTVTLEPPHSMFYYVDVSNDCSSTKDSVWIEVRTAPNLLLLRDTTICKGETFEAFPFSNLRTITWENHPTLTLLPTNYGARIRPLVEQDYFLEGVDQFGCPNKDTLSVKFFPLPPYTKTLDTTICFMASVDLSVQSSFPVNWHANTYTPNSNQSTIHVTPLTETNFLFNIDYGRCTLMDSIRVLLRHLPTPELRDSFVVCENTDLKIVASGADSYSWTPSDQLNINNGGSVIFNGTHDQLIEVSFTNICGLLKKETFIKVINPKVFAFGDTTICPDQSAVLFAEGALSYRWVPSSSLNNAETSTVIATPQNDTRYIVYGADQYGCIAQDSIWVNLYPRAFVHTNAEIEVLQGDTVVLSAFTNGAGDVFWSPSEYLSCTDCLDPIAIPQKEINYTVYFIDDNGCKDEDDIKILFNPLIYIPNSFTPDGRGVNEVFKAVIGNVMTFKMEIYNRWGEQIFISENKEYGWDGTYKGDKCPDGTYSWKIYYKDLRGVPHSAVGHVNLLK